MARIRILHASVNDMYYDLQGRRISTPNRGLYIKNGKKVLVNQ